MGAAPPVTSTPPARTSPDDEREPRTADPPPIAAPPLPVADQKGSLDRAVFTVSAVLALAFVAWGFLSPGALGSASGSALTWIESNLGWLFVTLASAFVVYVLWLAARKDGPVPPGRGDRGAGVRALSWVAV